MKKWMILSAMILVAAAATAQIEVTCAEAVAAMPATAGEETTDTYLVTGYVTYTNGTVSPSRTDASVYQQTFYMDDQKGTTRTLQGYWCNLPGQEALAVGDKISLLGKIYNYNGTAEIKNGDVTIIERNTEKIDTLGVSEAKARVESGWSGACYVKGRVAHMDVSGAATYGNIIYWLISTTNPADSAKAYRIKGLNNVAYTGAQSIEFEEGDEVIVYTPALEIYTNSTTSERFVELNTGWLASLVSGKPIKWLEWTNASAKRLDGSWQLTIAASTTDGADALLVSWPSEQLYAIGGTHAYQQGWQLPQDGKTVSLTGGYITLTYAGRDTKYRHLYDVNLHAENTTNRFRLNAQLVIEATDASGVAVPLIFDVISEPKDGDQLSCIDAKEYGQTFAPDSISPITLSVTGYMVEWKTSDGMSFWMDDSNSTTWTFYVYHGVMPHGVTVQKGSKVKITGHLGRHNDLIEIKDGAIQIISGAVTVPSHEVDVDEAVTYGKSLSQGQAGQDMYVVTGYVSGIQENYKPQYGDISIWMSNERNMDHQLLVYHAECTAELAALLTLGAKVRVTGRIQNYKVNSQSSRIEIITGKIEVLAAPPSLTVLGQQVSILDPANPNILLAQVDVFADGKLVYNIEENILTMSGLTLTGVATAIHYDCADPLTLMLRETSSIKADTVLASHGDLIIMGDGKFVAEGATPIIGAETAMISFQAAVHARSLTPAAAADRRTGTIKFGKQLDETGGPALSGFGSADFNKVNVSPSDALYGTITVNNPTTGITKAMRALYRINNQGHPEALTEFITTPKPDALEQTRQQPFDPNKPMFTVLGLPVRAGYTGLVVQQGGVYWVESAK